MYCALYLFFVAFTQLAFLNILTGLFVENAMKLAQPDRDLLALEHRKEMMARADHLKSICSRFEQHGDGLVQMDEFLQMMEDGDIRAQLTVLGIDVKDAAQFFEML